MASYRDIRPAGLFNVQWVVCHRLLLVEVVSLLLLLVEVVLLLFRLVEVVLLLFLLLLLLCLLLRLRLLQRWLSITQITGTLRGKGDQNGPPTWRQMTTP
jgi:hypothetical protein